MPNLDAFDESGLHAHLKAEAEARHERFYLEQRGDEWVAELRAPNELAGQVVHVGDAAAVLPGETISRSVNGPDRMTAMRRLAGLLAGEYG